MKSNSKKRLDVLVMQARPEFSRAQAQLLITKRAVQINGVIITKPGSQYSEDAQLVITDELRYVSRAGYKLEKALRHFSCNVQGFIVLDAGISTGGFTDCLLQNGCARVYGVDVGHGLVHEKISNDPRVEIYEGCNLKSIKNLPELVDLVTLDISFISLKKVILSILPLMKKEASLIALIKPQFEADPKEVARGGIVKNSDVQNRVRQEVIDAICAQGFICEGWVATDVDDQNSKNIEFLAYFKRLIDGS